MLEIAYSANFRAQGATAAQVGDLPMQPVPNHGADKAEDVSITAVITMSTTAAIGSNGLTNTPA